MLTVEVILKESKGKGLGIFAKKSIKKNQLVWIDNPIIDHKISQEEFNTLPKLTQDWLREFSPFNGTHYCLDGDQMRHCNHSFKPNINFKGDKAFANRKIKRGEEILTDYSEYDVLFAAGEHRFKIKK